MRSNSSPTFSPPGHRGLPYSVPFLPFPGPGTHIPFALANPSPRTHVRPSNSPAAPVNPAEPAAPATRRMQMRIECRLPLWREALLP